ncbi:hypothetical protein ACP4OV_007406 [Aristida adscensionis]
MRGVDDGGHADPSPAGHSLSQDAEISAALTSEIAASLAQRTPSSTKAAAAGEDHRSSGCKELRIQ